MICTIKIMFCKRRDNASGIHSMCDCNTFLHLINLIQYYCDDKKLKLFNTGIFAILSSKKFHYE